MRASLLPLFGIKTAADQVDFPVAGSCLYLNDLVVVSFYYFFFKAFFPMVSVVSWRKICRMQVNQLLKKRWRCSPVST